MGTDLTPADRSEQLLSAVEWRDDHLAIIDQTALPTELRVLKLRTLEGVLDAVRRLAVRGAPALGITGAYGVALGLRERRPATTQAVAAELDRLVAEIEAARPTAVNLGWGARRAAQAARAGTSPAEAERLALAEAGRIAAQDRESCRLIGEHGRAELAGRSRLLTHCNTGRLATAGIGTALGVVYTMAAAGEPVQVWAPETRPLLQGARLTAWELATAGIPVTLLPDTATGSVLAGGQVDAVIVGCDRVARNGDTANKVGTYNLAVLARANGVPFYVAGPMSSFDPDTPDGSAIVIEQRSPDEVRGVGASRTAPDGVAVWNPAFDVTPAELITAFVTDVGVLRPPYEASIARALAEAERRGLR